jgi:dynein heavy chain
MSLFQETKWLSRLGIEIPNIVKELCSNEKKFKQYKSNLDMLLLNYKKVLRLIPEHYLGLFEPHVKQTLDLTNPGCSILTWNSLNIDSFLKSVEIGIQKLKNLVLFVIEQKENSILEIVNEINETILFDTNLAFEQKWVIY